MCQVIARHNGHCSRYSSGRHVGEIRTAFFFSEATWEGPRKYRSSLIKRQLLQCCDKEHPALYTLTY